MTEEELQIKLEELVSLPGETEWVEFKHNNHNPELIGAYISALSNSACLHDKDSAYIVWGIEDETKSIIGTTFKPNKEKKGAESLEPWLARLLSPRIDFEIFEFLFDGFPIVMFQIDSTQNTPVAFKGISWVRVGSHKKKLKDYPEKERKIWAKGPKVSFEKGAAVKGLSGDEALAQLNYPEYFRLMKLSLPGGKKVILDKLVQEKFILRKPKTFQITNLGAILFARDLDSYDSLGRKIIRVIIYDGKDRRKTRQEPSFSEGYAIGFEKVIGWINDQLPRNEEMGQALRKEVKVYPEVVIRELIANAIIHQDFDIGGTSPMVEIFDNRIEITNSGIPLIDTLRFIDHSPESRNELLAKLMRRIGICEERGSGIDKVIAECELYQLPAPHFIQGDNYTRVILFAPKTLRQMDRSDKERACYQHACLRHVSGEQMTNLSLRSRFEIQTKNYSTASRIIKMTLESGLIKEADPTNKSKKFAKYLPFWA